MCQDFEEYINPHEAAERLYAVSHELEKKLHLVAMRLTAHVVELDNQKRKLAQAWAELEHQ